MPLAEKIRESIQRGEFVEQYCTALQQITIANFEAGIAVLHVLQQEPPALQHEFQIRTLLRYINRFVVIFGIEKLKPWYKLILDTIDTKDRQIFKVLQVIIREMLIKDPLLRDSFLDSYCQNKNATSNYQKILITYAEAKPKEFLIRVSEYLTTNSKSCFLALNLLAKLAFRQRTDLRLVSQTPVLFSLLPILQTENDDNTVALCLITFLMCVPFILNALPSLLPKLFNIFKRLLCWNKITPSTGHEIKCEAEDDSDEDASTVSVSSTSPVPSSLQRLTIIFLHHLYGLFPCNLIKFLKRECACDIQFRRYVEPLLGTLRISVMMLEGRADSELSPTRWTEYLQSLELFVSDLQRRRNSAEEEEDDDDDDDVDDAVPVMVSRGDTHSSGPDSQSEETREAIISRDNNKNAKVVEKNVQYSKGKDVNSESATTVQHEDNETLSVKNTMKSPVIDLQTTLKQSLNKPSVATISNTVDSQSTNTNTNTTNRRRSISPSSAISKHLKHNFFSTFLTTTMLGINYFDHLAEIYKSVLRWNVTSNNNEPNQPQFEAKTQITKLLDDPTESKLSLQKIIQLQNLLETSFSSSNAEDLWLSNDIQSLGETKIMGRHPLELQKHILLLRNQLLFERYLRQHYLRMLAEQRQTIRATEEMQLYAESLNAKLKSHKQVETELKKQIQAQKQEIHNLKEQNNKIVQKFNSKLQTFAETIESLEEQLQTLKVQCEAQQGTISALKVQVNQKDDQIFRLETKIADLTSQLAAQGDSDVKSTLLTEQVILWQLQQKQNEINERHRFKLTAKLQENEKFIHALNTRIEKLTQQITELTQQVEDSRFRLHQHEVEKEELLQRHQQLKTLLETQKNISQAKIRAVEEKYQCIKAINLRLEKEIISLQTELEKYKHWIDTQTSLIADPNTRDTKA